MAEVRLQTRWAGYLAGEVVSVSDDRAVAMEEAGICRRVNGPVDQVQDEDAGKKTKKK